MPKEKKLYVATIDKTDFEVYFSAADDELWPTASQFLRKRCDAVAARFPEYVEVTIYTVTPHDGELQRCRMSQRYVHRDAIREKTPEEHMADRRVVLSAIPVEFRSAARSIALLFVDRSCEELYTRRLADVVSHMRTAVDEYTRKLGGLRSNPSDE